MNVKLAMMILVACCMGLLSWMSPVMGQGSCGWILLPSGTDGTIYCTAVFDDGTGPALYVGGQFTTAGVVTVNSIAKWDGTSWSALGSGITGANHEVTCLTVFDDGSGPALYVGGSFTMAGGNCAGSIAKWDGGSWSPLGSGFGPFTVTALTTFEYGLYAAASQGFGNIVARWNAPPPGGIGAWDVRGSMDSWVASMVTFDDGSGAALYVGGYFESLGTGTWVGSLPVHHVAKLGPGNNGWSAVGQPSGGPGSGVHTLCTYDDGAGPALYAHTSDPLGLGVGNLVEKWDGATWTPVGPVTTGHPAIRMSLHVFDDGLGPALYSISNSGVTWGLSKWDGIGWLPQTTSSFGIPSCLCVFDDGTGPALYVGGSFQANPYPPPGPTWDFLKSCPSTITVTATQASPGAPLYLADTNLTPYREYHNVFSLDTCPGGPGSGPLFGLCLTTMPNYIFILDQLHAPLGTPLFHFLAQDSYTIWGGYQIPPMTVDGIVFDFTGGMISSVSPVTHIVIQ